MTIDTLNEYLKQPAEKRSFARYKPEFFNPLPRFLPRSSSVSARLLGWIVLPKLGGAVRRPIR
jgi:hypothetical protein